MIIVIIMIKKILKLLSMRMIFSLSVKELQKWKKKHFADETVERLKNICWEPRQESLRIR